VGGELAAAAGDGAAGCWRRGALAAAVELFGEPVECCSVALEVGVVGALECCEAEACEVEFGYERLAVGGCGRG
jgi:hypothetical protein